MNTTTLIRAVAMNFEVVWLDITCACMNYMTLYSARYAHVLGGSGGILDFRPSEVVSDAMFE